MSHEALRRSLSIHPRGLKANVSVVLLGCCSCRSSYRGRRALVAVIVLWLPPRALPPRPPSQLPLPPPPSFSITLRVTGPPNTDPPSGTTGSATMCRDFTAAALCDAADADWVPPPSASMYTPTLVHGPLAPRT